VDPTGHGRLAAFDALAAVEHSNADPGLRALPRVVHSRERGTSLGVVTGRPDTDSLRTVGAVSRRFAKVTLVQVGKSATRAGPTPSGVTLITCETIDDFVRVWKSRIG
jgi:hypothetical protein